MCANGLVGIPLEYGMVKRIEVVPSKARTPDITAQANERERESDPLLE